jgi:hypothetical protein
VRALGKWAIALLTLAWLVWELIANFDNSRSTWPLTHLIIQYVPVWIYFPGTLTLAAWLIWHFWPGRSGRRPDTPEGIMAASTPTRAGAKVDARNRAVRTFAQGLWVTALGAGTTAATAAIAPGIHWTREYWTGVGLAVAGAVTMAAASYVHRLVSAPPL